MSAVTWQGVRKVYPNGQVALQGLDLAVADGELLVLVGPSGCGKSTALKVLAGLEAPSAGRVLLDDRDVTALPPQERDLAMVFQSYALYPHKTVRDNLAFPLRMKRVASEERRRRVEEAAATLGIGELLDRRPAQLSGGQRQRVALGRALVREPAAFLLDEPLSNLDARLRIQMRAELLRLKRAIGTTMIHVTHDQEEALTLGDRVAVLNAGRLEQVGPPMEVYRRPATTFVASFVGAMNLWPDGDGTLGVRPEDVELVAAGEGDLAGEVDLVEAIGAALVVHVRGAREVVVRAAPDAPIQPGERVGLRLRRLHRFDAEGRRTTE